MSNPRFQGFTLIELLLYVGVAAVLLFGVSITFSLLLGGRVKSETIEEVETQGAEVLAYVTQLARNADSITLPQKGTATSTLTLHVFLSANDPTIIDLASGTIRIREGAGSLTGLTNSKVTASNLVFTNLSRTTSTPGIIRINFTLTRINPTGRNEYNYTQTFFGSAALR